MKCKEYQFHSCFAAYIEQFIQEKRSAGFIYETEVWKLKHFDLFCIEESVGEPVLSRELVKKWGTLKDGESLGTCSARVSVIRQFALFLISMGMEAYLPHDFYKTEKRVVHVLSDAEIRSFFENVDNYVPKINAVSFQRLSIEYKVLFRIIYCCGLRISEARKLKWEDVDLHKGTLRIMQSKGHKDRLVYITDDLADVIKNYKDLLAVRYHLFSGWVFPARETDKCLTNVTIEYKFRNFWSLTPYAEGCDKSPTVHSLRHTFVVKRMNLWMENGTSLREMLPFLSRYLGHQSPDETFYYYHQVAEAFRIIRKNDKTGISVIPEVELYE